MAARALIDEFRRVDPATDADEMTSIRSAIASALFFGASDSMAHELAELASERVHGGHRSLIVLALGELRKSKAVVVPALVAQLDDDTVASCAVQALVKLKATEARTDIDALVGHPNKVIRDEARKAIRKL